MISDSVSSKTSGTNLGEATGLSQHVFANPGEFLQTLQSNFLKIAQSDQTFVSKANLELYAGTGKDEKTREAARIAADHFDELKYMPFPESTLPSIRSGANSVLSYDEVVKDQDIYKGNMTSELIGRELKDAWFFTLFGANGVLGGLAGIFGHNAQLAIGAPLVFGTGCVILARDMYKSYSAARELSANTQRKLASWGEFNT